jgi:hypothetical protein
MCDSGAGSDGREEGGAAMPCLDSNGQLQAPRLFQGPAEPTWSLNLTNTVTIGDRLRLYSNIDAQGGHVQYDDGIAARHTSWTNSLASNVHDDPIFVAYTQIDRNRLGTYDAGFARLREVGVNYTLPEAWVSRVGASRGSINAAVRNLPYLWRAEERTSIGNEPIRSPETLALDNPGGASGNFAFSGESHSAMAPTSNLSVRLNLTF